MAIKNHSNSMIMVELPPEPDIRKELDTLMNVLHAGSNCDVIIDFSEVDIMTSMTLSGFLMVRELLAKTGRRLIFCNTCSITRDIFTITCFDGIFEFTNDKEKAVQMLETPQPCEQTAK